MLKRLVVSVVEGTVVGGLASALLLGLGFDWSHLGVVYGAAAVTGAATGLLAGKPFWAKSAKLEALLKASVGTFLALTSMYGLRKWLPGVSLNLGTTLGSGSIGGLPAASLPVIATAIALLFEVDDAFGPRAVATRVEEPESTTFTSSRVGDGESSTAHSEEDEESSDASDDGSSGVTRRGG
jgi:hypothetical protein